MPSSSSYPTELDSFTNPTDTLGGPNGNAHDDAHRHLADAIVKLETELGVDPSGAKSSVADYLQWLTPAHWNGNGSSLWVNLIDIPGTATFSTASGSVTRIGNFVEVSGAVEINVSPALSFPTDATVRVRIALGQIGSDSGLFSTIASQQWQNPGTATYQPWATGADAPRYVVASAALSSANTWLDLNAYDSTHVYSTSANSIRFYFTTNFIANI